MQPTALGIRFFYVRFPQLPSKAGNWESYWNNPQRHRLRQYDALSLCVSEVITFSVNLISIRNSSAFKTTKA